MVALSLVIAACLEAATVSSPPSETGRDTKKPVVSKSAAKTTAKAPASTGEKPKSDPVPPEMTLCDLNVANAELAGIAKFLSEQTKVNLLLISQPETKLTIRVTRMPLIELLKHISALSGLRYLKVSNTFVLATAEQLENAYPKEWAAANRDPEAEAKAAAEKEEEDRKKRQEEADALLIAEAKKKEDEARQHLEEGPVVTKTFTTNYVPSKEAIDMLTKLVPNPKLVLVSVPTLLTPTVSDRDTSATTGAASGILTKEGANSDGRTILMQGPHRLVALALENLQHIDVAPPQVSIGVTIHDIANEAVRELGLSWNYGDIQVTEEPSKGFNFGKFTRTGLSFNAAIAALEKTDQAKLLSSPNVTVQDGERAFVLIGERLNFPRVVGFTQANTPIFDVMTERVGIYLQVAPRVSSDGTITLSLYPQVSTVSRFITVNGASYPQIATREAQSTLRVKSGDTIVMAGLLRDDELKTLEKVPILGDIPILGELFTRRKKTKVASQVIITITPVILNSTNP